MTLRSSQAYEQHETGNRQPYVVIRAGHVGFFIPEPGNNHPVRNTS
jgi:poly(3-hydroxyalkanoate) synthetase